MPDISTIIFMILILGYTWGGLVFLVNKAFRKEKQKTIKK